MAKCVKKDGEIKRLPENNMKEIGVVSYHIRNGWSFVSKSEWKKSIRGQEETVKAEKKEKVKKDKN
jgi:hypothetical protein